MKKEDITWPGSVEKAKEEIKTLHDKWIEKLINMSDAEYKSNFLYHAPTLIIVSNLKDNGNSMPDSALAIGNMMLAAHSLGAG